MRRHFLILVSLLLAGAAFAQNGIFVDQPKVYDDYYLQSQLDSLKARLAAINAADQTTLLGKIGGVQGANLQQSGFAIQGMGPATPQVTTSLPPAGIAPSSSNGTTTVTNPMTPAAATPPAPTLTAPSTFSPSSLDTLNEEMQLSSQIINLQLLLDGALNDKFTKQRFLKRRVTIGFSITIEPPEDKKKQVANRLAEVEIKMENPTKAMDYVYNNPKTAIGIFGSKEGPSIMTLLPKEKTYNVASLVDKSISIGAGGVIAGVFNVGAGWFRGKKTYYLVQQQDTLSLQRSSPDQTSQFAWQFRPVLGSKFVASGTRQTFVQFSIPVFNESWDCSAILSIRTGWRSVDPKTGLTSALTNVSAWSHIEVPYFDPMTVASSVDLNDIGGGLISVSVKPYQSFMSGTHFRMGNTSIDQTYPSFSFLPQEIKFTASVKDISALGVVLVSRDGREIPLYNQMLLPGTLACGENSPHPLPSSDPPSDPTTLVASVSAAPFSDTQSLVTITFSSMPTDFSQHLNLGSSPNPVVVTIGDQVYGLRNAPFRGTTANSIALLAPTDSLRANRSIRVGQLLYRPGFMTTAQLDPKAFPSINFSIGGASIVSTGDPQVIAITGSGLKGTTLVSLKQETTAGRSGNDPPTSPAKEPPPCMSLDAASDTLIYLAMHKACVDKYNRQRYSPCRPPNPKPQRTSRL
jgi:hypothetical protein